VLLTRSRLCPGPKPGSSLHLHVLGTPPAFVLSQDQTLREELHTKSRQEYEIAVVEDGTMPAAGDDLCPGSVPGGMRTLAPTAFGRSKYTRSGPAQDGVNLGTVVCPDPEGSFGATASNLDTQSRSMNRSKSVHAVEFSKTAAPLQKGFLFRDAPGVKDRLQTGPESIAPALAGVRNFSGAARRTSRGGSI
jgi:hypothetical protein